MTEGWQELEQYYSTSAILYQSYNPCTILKIQSEQMAEGYGDLEWDCMAVQNHNPEFSHNPAATQGEEIEQRDIGTRKGSDSHSKS